MGPKRTIEATDCGRVGTEVVQAGAMAKSEITPIPDVRGGSDFRYQLTHNILLKFFYETAGQRELLCLQ